MRGQLIPFIFVILVAAGIFIGYIFYNIFYGTKYQTEVFHIRIIDVIRNLIEEFKNYLQLSLTYSSHQSLREHACVGGTIEVEDNNVIVAPWICNGPAPVQVGLSKNCLEVYTKYYLNIYLDQFNSSLPVELFKANFTNCVYGVNDEDVLAGKYDEGNFWINCTKAKLIISGKNIREQENVNINDFITKNRYWYMFRIFYEWAMNDTYSPCICSKIGCACDSTSGAQSCSSSCINEVEDCAQRALDDLQRRFDDNVKCEKERVCCAQGIGPPCLLPSPCLDWTNTLCSKACEHTCYKPPPPENICPVTVSPFTSLQNFNFRYASAAIKFSSSQNSLSCCCDYWYEARLASAYEFKCTDRKYYVPSDKGPVPLTFAVTAYAYWRDQDACRRVNKCDCRENAISCSECSGICCTGCYPC